jgi:hypothetical protein
MEFGKFFNSIMWLNALPGSDWPQVYLQNAEVSYFGLLKPVEEIFDQAFNYFKLNPPNEKTDLIHPAVVCFNRKCRSPG